MKSMFLSVNDAFVMYNWCKKLKVKRLQRRTILDGDRFYIKLTLGLSDAKTMLKYLKRTIHFRGIIAVVIISFALSWRYSMVVNNGNMYDFKKISFTGTEEEVDYLLDVIFLQEVCGLTYLNMDFIRQRRVNVIYLRLKFD